jgi:hypothetical protein
VTESCGISKYDHGFPPCCSSCPVACSHQVTAAFAFPTIFVDPSKRSTGLRPNGTEAFQVTARFSLAEPFRIEWFSAYGLACSTVPIRCVALIAFFAVQIRMNPRTFAPIVLLASARDFWKSSKVIWTLAPAATVVHLSLVKHFEKPRPFSALNSKYQPINVRHTIVNRKLCDCLHRAPPFFRHLSNGYASSA